MQIRESDCPSNFIFHAFLAMQLKDRINIPLCCTLTTTYCISKSSLILWNKSSQLNLNSLSPEGNFPTCSNLNVDIFGVPSQKCHRLSLVSL